MRFFALALVAVLLVSSAVADDCDQECIDSYDPVCASNGITFQNECRLQVAACRSVMTFSLLHRGECTADECPAACTRIYAPVCANNQKTYANECELEREACQLKAEVYAVANGECPQATPCEQQMCSMDYAPVCMSGVDYSNRCQAENKACELGLSLNSVAITDGVCPCEQQMCSMDYLPVCMNGVAYSNRCQAENKACELGLSLNSVTITDGACPQIIPCEQQICTMDYAPVCMSGVDYSNRCQAENKACELGLDLHSVAITDGACSQTNPCDQQPCTMEYAPVCGSDLVTYGNMCMLRKASCNSVNPITSLHSGECTCDEVICTDIYDPVCALVRGIELKTYSNSCEESRAKCKTANAVQTLHTGVCTTKDKTATFTYGPRCEVACPQYFDPVCGNDGRTYSNECELHNIACGTTPRLVVEKTGACVDAPLEETTPASPCDEANCVAGTKCVEMERECFTTPCPQYECVPVTEEEECPSVCPMIFAPVCGSDLRVYGNKCQIDVAICQAKKAGKAALTMLHEGTCVAEDCSTKWICPKVYRPVCATNGKTYPNACFLDAAVCEASFKGEIFTVAYDGECKIETPGSGSKAMDADATAPNGSSNLAIIIGAAVGGVALVALAIVGVVVTRKRSSRGFEPLLASPAEVYSDSMHNADLDHTDNA